MNGGRWSSRPRKSHAGVGCEGADGAIADATDCDDADDAIHPDAHDVCDDGVDQDCDGTSRTCPYVGALDADTEAAAVYAWDDAAQPYINVQIGDVTGDGVRDLLVDYEYDSTVVVEHDLVTASGAVPIRTDGYALRTEDIPTAASGGLDYTGDGAPDLLVGFDGDDTAAYDAGRIELVEGPISASGELPAPCATFYGEASADVLVTNPELDDEYDAGSTVFLFYGPVSGALTRNTDADASFEGPAGAGFGSTYYQPAVHALGDLDGDGADDFMVPAIDSDDIWLFHRG